MLWDDKVPGTDRSRWIYKKTQRGFYSVRQEQFLTDKERSPDGEFGPEWQPVEEREEENFYFRLMKDPETGDPGCDPKQWLLDFIDQRTREGKPFVVPDFRVAELRNAVEKLEGDLCISRPAARLKWGIPFPESFGAGFVTYVWFDALVNYISYAPGHDPNYSQRATPENCRATAPVAGEPAAAGGAPALQTFARFWPPLHVIGKDILIPAHGVYWPIMLKALGFADEEMPTLLVHGWWNIKSKSGESEKMSKSLGNVVDPDVLADKYGAEAVRYYLMSDIATGRDADFSEERLVQRFNTDLANSLGNLLNRTLNMAAKYREGKVIELPLRGGAPIAEDDFVVVYTRWMDNFQINEAFAVADVMAQRCNGFIEARAPWKLAKDPAQGAELDAVLYHLAESLRVVAILISPVLPKAAHGIFDQLSWKMELSGKEERFRLADAQWGGLCADGQPHQLGSPTPLFPRIEAPAS
jgi:methionyl-tRNA synthetase